MAKWEYNGFRLARIKGEWIARWGTAPNYHRALLHVKVSEGVGAGKRALIKFVDETSRIAKVEDTLTVGELFEKYMTDRESEGVQIRNFKDNWRNIGPEFGHYMPHQISVKVAKDYAKKRMEMGRARDTIWTELGRLRSCLNWAEKHGYLDRAPYVWVPSKGKPRQRVLSRDEVTRLLQSAECPHTQLFIILAICTGGRSGAILELTWDRVDFEGETIDLRIEDKRAEKDIAHKGYKKGRAKVHMNSLARKWLEHFYQFRDSRFVIEWKRDRCKSVKRSWRTARRRAGLDEKVYPHTLRHSVASWGESEGVEILKVSRFLGHKQLSTTHEIYSKPDVKATRDAAEVANIGLELNPEGRPKSVPEPPDFTATVSRKGEDTAEGRDGDAEGLWHPGF